MTVAQRSRAADMIARKGQVVTIEGALSSTYDPATGTVTTSAFSATASAVILPLSEFRKANNALVKEGDEQMLLAGLDTDGAVLPQPPIDSAITLAGGAVRSLIAVSPLDPDGDGSIIYDCVVRGNAP